MNITDCEGYKKLLVAVEKDEDRDLKGCRKSLFHDYRGKLNWIVSRVNHYSDKTGIPASDLLDKWESLRDYWYMNYYQDCKQPEIKDGQVKVFDAVDDFKASVGKEGFRCPFCGGVSSNPYSCNSGLIVNDIKDGKDRECNWKSFGLFGDLGKGIYVFVKSECYGNRIFMPIAWEGNINDTGEEKSECQSLTEQI